MQNCARLLIVAASGLTLSMSAYAQNPKTTQIANESCATTLQSAYNMMPPEYKSEVLKVIIDMRNQGYNDCQIIQKLSEYALEVAGSVASLGASK